MASVGAKQPEGSVFEKLVTDAGGKEEVLPYLIATGIDSIPLMARVAKNEEELLKDVVQPLIDGTEIGGTGVQVHKAASGH